MDIFGHHAVLAPVAVATGAAAALSKWSQLRRRAIRGFISTDFITGFSMKNTLKNAVIVSFQFNPEEVDHKMSVKYGDFQPPGAELPVKYYVSGGERTVSFTLHLDATGWATSFELIRVDPLIAGVNMFGVEPTKLAIESFIRSPKSQYELAQVKRGTFDVEPPPDCILCIGPMIFRTKMTELSFKDTLFNKFLVPMRSEATLKFSVIEDLEYYETYKNKRDFFARNSKFLSVPFLP